MKKHTTKRALLMSALSLLVCVSMLVGATFAWFTDSVSSDRNIIQAGNLDITLKYWDGDSYEDVTSSTKLFNDEALWEPGHAEIAYLKIDNAGSLALKYQLAVNVYNETSATNVAGDTFWLSKHLVFSVVDKALTSRDDMYTREEAVAAAGNAMGLKSYKGDTVEMLPDDTDYVALIIYMPTSVGNEANYKTGTAAPTITLGTTLVATQMASEQDSWNENFDMDAPYPVLSLPAPMPETGAAAEDIVLNTEKGTETGIPAELVADIANEYPEAEELRLTHTEPVIDTTAKTVTFTHFDIVDDKGNVIDLEAMNNTTPVTVVISVGDAFAEGDVVVIYHDKEAVASAVVSADKTVTYTTTHFCEVVVSTGDGTLDSAAELAAAVAAGGTIKLEQDMVLSSTLAIPQGLEVVLDLNGHKLISTNMNTIRNDGGKLTIKNGTVERTGDVVGYAVNNASGEMVVDNATIIGGLYTSGSKLTATNANISHHQSSRHAIYAYNCEVTINGGTYHNYSSGNATIMVAGSTVCTINSGTFSISDGRATAQGWTSCMLDGTGAFVINGGTFNGGFRVQGGGKMTINDGIFNDCFGSNYNVYTGGVVQINGGTFTDANSISFAKKYAASGVEKDGQYIVANAFVTDAAALEAAVAAGGTIVLEDDIVMTKNLGVSNANFTLNGNGHTITLAEGASSGVALFDITGGKVTFKNVTFDGIKGGAVLRTVYAESVLDNVTVQNCAHTEQQGLIRLLGKATVTNCTIRNNTCNFAFTYNYDNNNGDPAEPLVLSNCVFENNTCNDLAVAYYAAGSGATIDGNKFIGNTAKSTANGATVYLGFKANCTVTNNIFKDNAVTTTGTSSRVAGALMVGNNTVIKNNAFVGNTVTGERAKANDVCASAYYCDIDLSGNYWGGDAPVENDDYYNEYPSNYKVIINDYLTSYEF